MAHIDYYFSTLSPYSYLAGLQAEEIAVRHNVELIYKPLDIVALFPRSGGIAPPDRHPSRMEYRAQELMRQAKKAKMALNLKPAFWPTNGAPSSYAIIAAQSAVKSGCKGDIGALVQGILRACWSEEKDIAQDTVIKACLVDAGFEASLADSGLLAGAEEYGRNLDQAVQAGVFGSPFYITEDDQRFWGQDRLEDLDAYLAGNL